MLSTRKIKASQVMIGDLLQFTDVIYKQVVGVFDEGGGVILIQVERGVDDWAEREYNKDDDVIVRHEITGLTTFLKGLQ